MFRVTFVQGNGQHCHCCRIECPETEEYFERREALSRAADLKAHAYWGQDITNITVEAVGEGFIGLDNEEFNTAVHRAIRETSEDYVSTDGSYDPLEAR